MSSDDELAEYGGVGLDGGVAIASARRCLGMNAVWSPSSPDATATAGTAAAPGSGAPYGITGRCIEARSRASVLKDRDRAGRSASTGVPVLGGTSAFASAEAGRIRSGVSAVPD